MAKVGAKANALAIFEKQYGQWESDPLRMENGYQYESAYAVMIGMVLIFMG